LALADGSQFSEYRFWMTFWPDGISLEEKAFFENIADLVARYLTLNDYQVARDPSSGRIGGPKLVYTRSADSAASGRNQVQVTEVI